MRWRALALVALLAGCAQGPGPDPLAGAVEAAPGLWLWPGFGAVRGYVVNDAGLALPDVRVSIIGAEHFGRTDGAGAFLFVNVTAGVAQLQLSAPNFQSKVLEVRVPDQAIGHANATLLPDASVGAGYLPHVHDLWAGGDTYTMLDQDFTLGSGSGTENLPPPYYALINGYYRGINNASRWNLPLATAPDDNRPIVLPGTKSMAITITWDDPTLDVLGICPFPPGESKVDCRAPKASPATWTIEVRPDQADGGHARWSLWQIHLYHPPWSQTMRPSTTAATVHATIELTKGNVPVDPAHPAFWADGNELVVHEGEYLDTSQCCSQHSAVRPQSIIPPGTTRVLLEHSWEFLGAGAGPLDFDYQLLVRTGSMNPHTTANSGYREPTVIEGSAQQMRKVYEMELEDGDPDAFYQQSSTWRIVFWNQLFGKDDTRGQHRDVEHTLRMVAYRDA